MRLSLLQRKWLFQRFYVAIAAAVFGQIVATWPQGRKYNFDLLEPLPPPQLPSKDLGLLRVILGVIRGLSSFDGGGGEVKVELSFSFGCLAASYGLRRRSTFEIDTPSCSSYSEHPKNKSDLLSFFDTLSLLQKLPKNIWSPLFLIHYN